MSHVKKFDPLSMQDYMFKNPGSNFVMFTHMGRRWPRADYLIRRALRYKYGVNHRETFSHTGSVWVEDGKLTYWHQTWPRFAKDEWSWRAYNVIYEVNDPAQVSLARAKCLELYEARRRYGIGKLLNFGVSMWIPGIGNAITAGKVCSEAVAVCYPSIILTRGVGKNDVDPQFAEHCLALAGMKSFIVDLRTSK